MISPIHIKKLINNNKKLRDNVNSPVVAKVNNVNSRKRDVKSLNNSKNLKKHNESEDEEEIGTEKGSEDNAKRDPTWTPLKSAKSAKKSKISEKSKVSLRKGTVKVDPPLKSEPKIPVKKDKSSDTKLDKNKSTVTSQKSTSGQSRQLEKVTHLRKDKVHKLVSTIGSVELTDSFNSIQCNSIPFNSIEFHVIPFHSLAP